MYNLNEHIETERPGFILFHVEHLKTMQIRDQEWNGLFALPDVYERMERLSQTGEALSMVDNGRVITCAGFVQLWPGVLEMWQIPSTHLADNPMRYARIIKRYIEQVAEQLKAHRIQTVCANDNLHTRWMDFLGFGQEGLLEQYSYQMEDFIQWARLFKWQPEH